MNTFIKSLAVLVATTIAASAQFISGPNTGPVLDTTTAVFIVPGVTTTNVASAYRYSVPVGKLGTGFQIYLAGTNSVTTTNAIIRFETSADGTYWIDTTTPTFAPAQNGTSGYTVYTNIPATSVNIGNLRFMRVKSIQNTNLASIFITNFIWSVKD